MIYSKHLYHICSFICQKSYVLILLCNFQGFFKLCTHILQSPCLTAGDCRKHITLAYIHVAISFFQNGNQLLCKYDCKHIFSGHKITTDFYQISIHIHHVKLFCLIRCKCIQPFLYNILISVVAGSPCT